MTRIGVLGAGTMGHGIAQVAALAGQTVVLADRDVNLAAAGVAKVASSLARLVEKGKLSESDRAGALERLRAGTPDEAAEGADLVVEAVPEQLPLKHAALGRAADVAGPRAILATNTSSLSIAAIAAGLPEPGRVVGTHFFNPVPVMALLEVVVADGTRDDVRDTVVAWGARLGKEVIVVRDTPGFATSRLGVCLGMEAIRMVEQGVASAEDIDKAMVLGYRHPIGPLRLTDLVGLDVRMAIGTYLAGALGNSAFEPPALMRTMVTEGRLGQKAGKGFYTWT